jgi:SAM-dependent methyltransferase
MALNLFDTLRNSMARKKNTLRSSNSENKKSKSVSEASRPSQKQASSKTRRSAGKKRAGEDGNSNLEAKLKSSQRDKAKEKKSKDKTKSKGKRTLAEKADRYTCYQKSVQNPEHDVAFFEQAYRDVNRRRPLSLREDFCGTFAVCCEWVKQASQRTAVGVDLCRETLQWGREHNLNKLKPKQQARIRLLEQDVRIKNLPPVDVLAAQNFSFWIFQTRTEVITYLRSARENLKPGGIMVLDMMGGGDCYREGNEDEKIIGQGKKKFRYYWKQVSFNPATNQAKFSISFRFRDGSKLENAFEYDWRFWTIPEVREMVAEAGFRTSRVYFENEEDDSIWEAREHAPSHDVWLAYIVAVR